MDAQSLAESCRQFDSGEICRIYGHDFGFSLPVRVSSYPGSGSQLPKVSLYWVADFCGGWFCSIP